MDELGEWSREGSVLVVIVVPAGDEALQGSDWDFFARVEHLGYRFSHSNFKFSNQSLSLQKSIQILLQNLRAQLAQFLILELIQEQI